MPNLPTGRQGMRHLFFALAQIGANVSDAPRGLTPIAQQNYRQHKCATQRKHIKDLLLPSEKNQLQL